MSAFMGKTDIGTRFSWTTVQLLAPRAHQTIGDKATSGSTVSIRDHISQAAQDMAARTKERLSHIERRLAEAKEQVAKIEAEHEAARLAPQRLSDFPIESGGNYLCPRCGVEKGGLSPLRHIPNDARDELLRCPVCEYELLIPHV
jgi:DNA-directed RNA polymerase subunit RPC12/RpoP